MSDYVTRDGGPPKVGDAVYYAKAERCDGCLFWNRHAFPRWTETTPDADVIIKSIDAPAPLGQCRRNPPACVPIGHWPITRRSDWCGAFQPTPEAPAAKPIDSEGDSHRRGLLELRHLTHAEPEIVLWAPATVPGVVPDCRAIAKWARDPGSGQWFLWFCNGPVASLDINRRDFFALVEIGNRWLSKHRPPGDLSH